MSVVLRVVAQGCQCRVYALADETKCLLADFLTDVERDWPDELPKLVRWFWDEGRMILCTHGFVKKSRKTPPREIARSLRMKANYEAAKQAKQLRFEAP